MRRGRIGTHVDADTNINESRSRQCELVSAHREPLDECSAFSVSRVVPVDGTVENDSHTRKHSLGVIANEDAE